MRHTNEGPVDPTTLRFYPPGSGPLARDGDGELLRSKLGHPVQVRGTSEVSWSCPDCGKNLGRSAVEVKSHFNNCQGGTAA